MIVMSFRTKKDKEHLLKKAIEMETYAKEIVDCLEEAKHYEEEMDDYDYSERSGRMNYRGGSMNMRNRYGYRG